MNENNTKYMQLIYSLMTAEGYMNIEQMSKAISMSQRTINNYLKQIRTDSELGNVFVLKKTAYGVKLNVVNSELYDSFKEKLELSLFHTKSGNKKSSNAIIVELLMHLLDADGYIKIRDLADEFFYSVGSVNKYLKDIKLILQAYSLTLEDKPYHGIRIIGEEKMIRHIYGDLIEYSHNQEGITSETTTYSKYYSTTFDDRNRSKLATILAVTSYSMPISNELLKTVYKYLIVAFNRFNEGYRVVISDEEKEFIRRFKALELARDIFKRLYQGESIMEDENEIYCLAGRIIVGFGQELSIENCPEVGDDLIDKANVLSYETIKYLNEKENISFPGIEKVVHDYLVNTYLTIIIGNILNDSTSQLNIMLKDDVVIKSQLSYSLAYKIGRYFDSAEKIKLSDKAVVQLSISLHYIFITAKAEPKKLDIILSTEYMSEENEAIKDKLLKRDSYGFINRIDIQYLYKVSQTYMNYDAAIFDFPAAYLKNYPMKCFYISEQQNRSDIESLYREIVYYATDFKNILDKHNFKRINMYNVNITITNLIRKLLSKNLNDETQLVGDMLNDVVTKHMLIQNGVLIIMNRNDSINSIDIYRANAMVVRDSKTYIDTVCFINYHFDELMVFVKIMELLANDINGMIEFIDDKKKTFINSDEIAEYINKIYLY